jgi:hypothetical protein
MTVAIIAVSLMLVGQVQKQPVVYTANNPVSAAAANLFVQLCVKGEATLPRDQISPATFDRIYGPRRDPAPLGSKVKIYHLSKPYSLYIRTVDYPENDLQGRRMTCSLMSNGTDLHTSVVVVLIGLGLRAIKKPIGAVDHYHITDPARNFEMIISDWEFYSTTYDNATSAKMLAKQKTTGRPIVQGCRSDDHIW